MHTHKTWLDLKPNKDDNLLNFNGYYSRIEELPYTHIPNEVIHQWILPHFNESNTVKNYSWIDLSKVKFELEEFQTSFFKGLNIIEDNKQMVWEYPINKFAPWHRKFWGNNGTWETPPIIINVNSFIENKPDQAELNGDYQLVEGHNRLGTLFLLIRDDLIKVGEKHKAWVMSKSID